MFRPTVLQLLRGTVVPQEPVSIRIIMVQLMVRVRRLIVPKHRRRLQQRRVTMTPGHRAVPARRHIQILLMIMKVVYLNAI